MKSEKIVDVANVIDCRISDLGRFVDIIAEQCDAPSLDIDAVRALLWALKTAVDSVESVAEELVGLVME